MPPMEAFDDSRLRVKVVGFEADPRLLSVGLPTTVAALKQTVSQKLQWSSVTSQPIRLRVKDEEGELICMDDDDDFAEALQLAKTSAFAAGRLIATMTVHIKM